MGPFTDTKREVAFAWFTELLTNQKKNPKLKFNLKHNKAYSIVLTSPQFRFVLPAVVLILMHFERINIGCSPLWAFWISCYSVSVTVFFCFPSKKQLFFTNIPTTSNTDVHMLLAPFNSCLLILTIKAMPQNTALLYVYIYTLFYCCWIFCDLLVCDYSWGCTGTFTPTFLGAFSPLWGPVLVWPLMVAGCRATHLLLYKDGPMEHKGSLFHMWWSLVFMLINVLCSAQRI